MLPRPLCALDRDRPPDELNLSAICFVTGMPTVVFAATEYIFHGRIEAHVAPIVIDVVVGVIIAVVLGLCKLRAQSSAKARTCTWFVVRGARTANVGDLGCQNRRFWQCCADVCVLCMCVLCVLASEVGFM